MVLTIPPPWKGEEDNTGTKTRIKDKNSENRTKKEEADKILSRPYNTGLNAADTMTKIVGVGVLRVFKQLAGMITSVFLTYDTKKGTILSPTGIPSDGRVTI